MAGTDRLNRDTNAADELRKHMADGLKRGQEHSKALGATQASLIAAADALRAAGAKGDPETIKAALLESQRAAKNIEEYIRVHRDGAANFIMVVK